MKQPASGRIGVLIVDDHELVRVGLCTLLSTESQIEVVGDVATGAEAIAFVRQRPPDVVLLDARLPDISGPDVCRRLRSIAPGAAIAMLTTFSDGELVRSCIRAGVQGYLLKDIAQLDLGQSIKALARGETVFDAKLAPLVSAARQRGPKAIEDAPLSTRQREILRLVAEGLPNREIAACTNLSELTVKGYVEEILQQLGARNRVQAAILATRRGWI